MKILVLTNRVPFPLKDGGNIATMQMLESLVHCGFDVKLLSLNTNKHYVETNTLPAIFKTLELETTSINTDVNFKSAFRNLFTDESYNAQRFYSPEFEAQIIRALHHTAYDIVFFEGIYTALYIDVVKQHGKAKCILRAHNVEYEIWQKAAREESFLKRYYINVLAERLKKYEIECWKKFDAIIPITYIDEAIIREHNTVTQNYLTLPMGVDIKKINGNNTNADIAKIFHLGSMDWTPNQQAMEWFMTNVWQRIEQNTRATFYMAGRNMPEEFYDYKSERVLVPGEIDDPWEFMRDKQIMVVPLFAGSGIRIKILEGMAAGKTIVTTSLGVQGIEAYHNEQVLIANNPKAFSDAVIWCINNELKAKAIGNNARKLIEEKYSLERFEEKLKDFLITLTKHPS